MGMLGFMCFATLSLTFYLSVLTNEAYASSRGTFGRNIGFPHANANGICANAIVVYGYKCQEHEVTTKDGYILSLQRIPQGKDGVSGNKGKKKQPVIIQHGVLVDGMTWLLRGPEQDLPWILADNGFDVWIANTRGTRYSRRHTSLDPSSREYWDWSWDEIVSNDLPAMFDYVFNKTGQKINYVGHSLGTLTALAALSEGELVNQVKSVALLSPIAYLSHMTTALGVIAAKSFLGEITTLFGLAEFNPRELHVSVFVDALCTYPGVSCADLLTAITGKNCCFGSSIVNTFLTYEPQSTSTKNMVHLAQTVRHGALTKFNYVRPDYNIAHYGDIFPPIYNLSNIPHDVPLFISYGGRDALSDTRDVANLLDILKFHDQDKIVVQFIEDYAHADYILAFNAREKVYNSVVSFFNSQV